VNLSAPIRSRHHLPRRLSAAAAAALIGASVLAGLAGCASGAAPAQQLPPSSGSPSGPRSASSPGPLSPPLAVDAPYKNAVETRVAGSLHLTAGQVRAELRANPGSDLENLAKPLSLSEDQLAGVIRSGLDSAASAESRSGTWTARQAQAEKMYWASQSDADLVTGVSSWFVNG
jgi:hypothetical protein